MEPEILDRLISIGSALFTIVVAGSIYFKNRGEGANQVAEGATNLLKPLNDKIEVLEKARARDRLRAINSAKKLDVASMALTEASTELKQIGT